MSHGFLACVGRALLVTGAACATTDGVPPITATAPQPGAFASHVPPRLVVAVVLDQVGTSTLTRLRPLLRPDGIVARVHRQGARHERVRLDYACTTTAPGHAAIFTGHSPSESGIFANDVWDAARGKRVAAVDDGVSGVLGVPGHFASPTALRTRGVADALRRARPGAKIVALSLKDRGAVLPGGERPDLALWYEPQLRGFTTSTWYAPSSPAWLASWEHRHPVDALLVPWEALDPAALASALGRDDAPGEGDGFGLGSVFPHVVAPGADRGRAVLPLPSMSAHLIDLALEATEQLHLGEDDVPDLLVVSISGTDYAGHVWGPASWEAADHLMRVDRMLAGFFEKLEARGTVAMLITADHGVAVLPESQPGGHGIRVSQRDLAAFIEAQMDRELGAGDWIADYAAPLAYLTATARARPEHARVLAALRSAALLHPAVHGAWTRGERSADPALDAAVSRSWPDGTTGDLFIVPRLEAVLDPEMPGGSGTNHGGPWEHDTDVPVLMVGAGVAHLESSAVTSQRRVAATLSALLGVPSPTDATPLDGLAHSRGDGYGN